MGSPQKNQDEITQLREALRAMLSDYRTEGCVDPNCGICRRSKKAEQKARAALSLVDEK